MGIGAGVQAAFQASMNSSGTLPVSEAARRVRKPKASKRGRPAKNAAPARPNGEREMAAPGTLTRTKSLLLAALKVWELKHRIGE
jgi:spore germination cell wall hydrolase CwlJ-like protein